MLKVTPNNFFFYILSLHKFTNTITEFKPCVYRADFMIIEEEVSSYTYANWVFLRQRSRSNHIELKLYACHHIGSEHFCTASSFHALEVHRR